MAVVTAAIAAVTAAIATTTVATVATAVVAVSAAVGVAGLAVGAIGMAIGNEDLMFAGKIMGYVGLAGGLAGGVIGGVGNLVNGAGTFTQGFADAFAGASQHLSEAWNKGVGSWFSGGEKVTGAIGSADDVTNVADDALKSVPTGSSSSPNGQMGAFPEVTTPGKSIVMPGDGVSVAPQATAPSMPSAPGIAAPATPSAPISQMTNPSAWVPNATPPASTPGLVQQVSEAASSMPDWMKYSLITTAGQGVAGLAGGYFQGAAAEEQARLQQQAADREEAQRQVLNRQGNQVPLLTFRQHGRV